jgi:hypothetical protein
MTVILSKQFDRLAVVAALAAVATGASAFAGNPTGDWAGTIKCTGVSANYGAFTGTPSATMSISGDVVVVYAGWIAPYITHAGEYFPDAGDPANKGTFGFTAVGGPTGIADHSRYSETGQAKLERRKDGRVTFVGNSYALSALVPGDVVSATCEWKFNKTSDTASPVRPD